MDSPNASVWQQSLNPKLVQRLNRPFMHSGVSPDQMGKVILDRTNALQGRLPLLEQQMQRWSTVVDLETPSIPIVYAQPGASGRPEEHQESSSEEITLDAIHSPLRPVVQAEWKQVAVQPEVVSLAVMAIAQARNSDQQDTSVYSARSPLQRPELVAQPVTVPIVRVRSSDFIRVPDAQQAAPAQASPAFANHSQQDHAISHSQRSLSPEIVPVKASSFTGSQSASPQTASPQTASPQTASPQTASLQPQLPDSSVPRSFLLLPGVENPATPGFFMPPIAIPSIQDGGNPQIQRKFDPSNFSSIESVLEPSSPIILKSQPAPSFAENQFAENQFAENQFAENQFAENHQVLTPVSLASMLPLTVPLVMPETLGTEKRWPTLDIVATRPTVSDSNLAPVIPNQSSVGQSSNQQHQASPQDKHTPRNKKASAQDSVRSTPARSQPVRSQPARSHPKGFAPQTQSGKKSPRSKKRTDAQQTASVLPHSPSSLSPEIIPVKVSSFTSSQSASPQTASPQTVSLQPQLPDSSVPRSLPLLPGVENPATPVFFIPPIAIASIQNGDSPQIQRRIDPSANQPLIFQTQHLQAQHLQAQHLQAHTEVTDTEPSPSRSIYGVHTSPLRPLNPPMLGDFQTLNPTDIHGFASEFDLWDLNLRDRQNRFGSPLYLRNHIPGYDISSVATLLLPQVSAQSQQPASTLLNIQPLPLLSPEPVAFIHQIAPITNSISRTQPLSVIKPDSPINSLQHEWVSFEDKKITVEFVSPEFKPLTFVNLEYTTPTLINPESEDPEYSTFTFVNPKSQNLEYTTPPFVNLESQNPEYTSPELANLEYISLPKPVQSLDVLTPPTHRVQMSVEQAQQQPSQSLLTLSTPSKAVENRSELGTTPSQLPLIQVETEIAPPSFEPLLLSVPNQGKPQAYPVQQQLSTSTSTSRTTSTSHSASHSASRSSSVHSPGASSAGQMASSYPIGSPLSTSPKPSQLHPVFQAGGVSNSPPAIDIDAIAEQVERKLMKRLVVESERRGKRKWH